MNPYAYTRGTPNINGTSRMQGGMSVDEASNPGQTTFLGHPASFFIGAILLLVALRYASRHPRIGVETKAIDIDGYNAFAVFLIWVVLFTGIRLLVNAVAPKSGMADYVNWL